jgi:hypothetical protein
VECKLAQTWMYPAPNAMLAKSQRGYSYLRPTMDVISYKESRSPKGERSSD